MNHARDRPSKAREPRPRAIMTRAEWIAEATRLFGNDPKGWRFKCPSCGHVQSHNSVTQNNPGIGNTENWIYFSCEGRHTEGHGCNWTLGGLFQIHNAEVEFEGKLIPVFEFAVAEDASCQPST